MKTKTILVTGALGHIGSKLIRSFDNSIDNLKIILLDNLKTCRYPSLFNLNPNICFNYIESDVRDDLLSIIPEEVDYVVHLAALTEPALSAKNPDQFIEHNLDCTNHIINFCLEKKAKLIAISSTSIYCKSGVDLEESDILNTDSGQSPYAKCKLMEELLITEKRNTSDLKATILRFGTIFGPSEGMRFHTAVNKFCWESSFGQPLSIWKTALHQQRPYLDLDDAVRAIQFSLDRNSELDKTFNVVTGNYTVSDIVSCIRKYRPQTKINLTSSTIMNDLSYTLSTRRIRGIGFKFAGSLDHSVKSTLDLLASVST
ncbi:Nucleoside-diphosphate-sugar epimerase [Synechococcus sp. BL107]|uniref:SDR family oxidoreductase n=1 Tax=Synechococcus sp. BL107 TaxID=313625 RepID=UPI0000E53B2E|nr:SDR family oxidoreductase [Synechococcus sp. BL107]EAU71044.1 Nucleoside-diphosphate-sugar epimerase [Synechococcus sp. BL107]